MRLRAAFNMTSKIIINSVRPSSFHGGGVVVAAKTGGMASRWARSEQFENKHSAMEFCCAETSEGIF